MGIHRWNILVIFSLKSGQTPGFLLLDHEKKNKNKGANRIEDGAVAWEMETEPGLIGFDSWNYVGESSFASLSMKHHKTVEENSRNENSPLLSVGSPFC